jgi:hypothetical protein
MNLIFNELALSDIPQDNIEAAEIMSNFIKCYSKVMKSGMPFSRSIQTYINLNEMMLNKEFHVYQWRNSVDKDTALAFKGICNRQIIFDTIDDGIELRCERGIGKGLLCAFQNRDVSISLASDVFWESFYIDAKIFNIYDDTEENVRVLNISKEDHVNENYNEINSICLKTLEYQEIEELLRDLDSLFPYLVFHKKAIDQLKTQVESQHISAIIRKLYELNEYFFKWDEGPFNPNQFKSKISPESQATLKMYEKEHTFSYEGGEILVSFHLRYTGKIAGRIFFYPDPKIRKGVICSLTSKLPTVSD